MIRWRQQLLDQKQKMLGIIALVVGLVIYVLLVLPYGFVDSLSCGRVDFLAAGHATLTVLVWITCAPHRFYFVFGLSGFFKQTHPVLTSFFERLIVLAIGFAASSMTIIRILGTCDFGSEPMHTLEGDIFTLTTVVSMLLSFVYLFYLVFQLFRFRHRTTLERSRENLNEIFKEVIKFESIEKFKQSCETAGSACWPDAYFKRMALFFLLLYFTWELYPEEVELLQDKQCCICNQKFELAQNVTLASDKAWSHFSCLCKSESSDTSGNILSIQSTIALLEDVKSNSHPLLKRYTRQSE